MHAARLRRTGFAATLVAGALMLGSAMHGMSQVDATLEVAAATQRDRTVFVFDAPAPQGHELERRCEAPREPRPRI
jgi:hypothetical protein